MSEEKKEAPFVTKIIAPKEVRSGDTIALRGAIIPKDGQQGGKLKFLQLVGPALTQLYKIKGPYEVFQDILASIAEGQDIKEFRIGVFFLLYERFNHQCRMEGKSLSGKMELLIDKEDNPKVLYRKRKVRAGKKEPLPIYVRNILAHLGSREEGCTIEDVMTSIELLKKWTAPK